MLHRGADAWPGSAGITPRAAGAVKHPRRGGAAYSAAFGA
jgi:hypothetical protein